MQVRDVGTEHELDFAGFVQLLHFLGRVGRAAEGGAAVHEGYVGGHVGEEVGPVQGRVAAAGNHNFLVAEMLGVAHHVVHAFAALKLRQVLHGRLARLERAQAAGNGHGLAVNLGAVGGEKQERAVVELLKLFHPLAEREGGVEGRNLLHEIVDQVAGQNFGETRNVVNRLLRINLRKLAAGLGQGIYYVAAELEQAGFKNCKQTDRAGPDDADIGGNGVGHTGNECL